ncbi:IclR family transcriptional regulator [Ramlibacter pallidus]|uniref:IclR family transcriptional regulator n=1 Tax=Ramlibacter pallidus TaxID=2780087 RepID=A0ABR9S8F1_9BURK|nr:IclR family transcriptional regulator [Ramlibacter pallidus]MBE7369562.1 IclR family transcriptional regulator [Ramlibacter pallidus]
MPQFVDPSAAQDRRYVTALARGMELLHSFRWGERWLAHQELTRRSQLPKATVSRLAFTLCSLGYLVHDPARGAYALGPGGLTLGLRVLANDDVSSIARPVLEELAGASGAAVSLGVRHQLSMVYIAHARGHARLSLSLDVGARLPIESTSMGRAFLCALPEYKRSEVYAQLQQKLGERWKATQASLQRAAEQYRQVGYVTSLGEWDSDISAVGAAVDVGHGGEPYALNIGGPSTVLTRQRLVDDLGPRLAAAALRIQQAIRNGRPAAA